MMDEDDFSLSQKPFFHRPPVTGEERRAIAAFLKARPATRFREGDSGYDRNLCSYLRSKGFKVHHRCSIWSNRATFFINGKGYRHSQFIAFVDRVRAEDGLPPLGVRDGAA